MDFGRRGRGGYAAHDDLFHAEGIGRAEHGAYVVERADVVEHHHEGELFGLAEGSDIEALQFLYGEFLHKKGF